MSIYVIGDLHLSFSENKPMDIFGDNWKGHEEKIKKDWIEKVTDNDEQLSMYDVLMKEDLSKEDIKKLKKVAVDLLAKIKDMIKNMSNPFDNSTAKATIIITIRDTLWSDLPESYSDESINYYKDAVYNYVSRRYGVVVNR